MKGEREMRASGVATACLAAWISIVLLGSALGQDRDLLLSGGHVVTLDAYSTVAEAVMVRDGRIAAIGSSASLRKQVRPGAWEIDLGGRTVIPGLIDSHIHAIRAGLTYSTQVNWIGAASLSEALERIRTATTTMPAGGWIVVPGGWSIQQFSEARRPTQDEIAQAAPGHPVYIQMSYVSALLSPLGFQKLEIAADADLPANGRLERDPEGRLTGWVTGDLGTIVALSGRLPKATLEQAMTGTARFFRELNRFGLTGISDPGGHNLALDQYAAVLAMRREHGLTLRVRYSLCAPRAGSELADFQALTRHRPMGSGDDWLRFNGLGECVTWGMYNNDHPDAAQRAEFEAVALWAARTGLTITVHWNNESSVHYLLDALEHVAQQVPIASLRWSIAHVHDATPQTLARMKTLGVGWLMQNRLYFAVPAFFGAYQRSRIEAMPPIVSALRTGLHVGGGTDADRVMSYNPFVALQWMLDGRTISGTPTRIAAEMPSREDALRIYTQGSAWFTHDEDQRGQLAPGMLADLAVLSDDILTMPVERIGTLTSLLTMVGGRIVYADGPYAGLDEPGRAHPPR
ncbi:MAG: TIM-barrel fold metal-dependent hydrolase [Hyphomicrobiales bacterium]|nr:TIM-barrel fold metal-dependent hydrolase [Hyphomicrobiales bacterium]